MRTRKTTNKKNKTGENNSSLTPVGINKNGSLMLNLLAYILYISFVFDVSIVLYPMTFIFSLAIRVTLLYFYEGSAFQLSIESYLWRGVSSETYTGISIWLLFKFFCMTIPYALFLMYYLLTTCLIFVAGIYSGCGTRNMENEGEYSEIKKLGDYLNNKQRFMGYDNFLEYLRNGRK